MCADNKLLGALLDEEIKEGEGPKIKGSVMLALAESKEEVFEALKRDIYSTSGVWDWEKVQIHPVRTPPLRFMIKTKEFQWLMICSSSLRL